MLKTKIGRPNEERKARKLLAKLMLLKATKKKSSESTDPSHRSATETVEKG